MTVHKWFVYSIHHWLFYFVGLCLFYSIESEFLHSIEDARELEVVTRSFVLRAFVALALETGSLCECGLCVVGCGSGLKAGSAVTIVGNEPGVGGAAAGARLNEPVSGKDKSSTDSGGVVLGRSVGECGALRLRVCGCHCTEGGLGDEYGIFANTTKGTARLTIRNQTPWRFIWTIYSPPWAETPGPPQTIMMLHTDQGLLGQRPRVMWPQLAHVDASRSRNFIHSEGLKGKGVSKGR